MGSVWPKKGFERLMAATSNLSDLPPQEETTLSIGRLNPSVYVVPLRRRHPQAVDWEDGNWVDARVTIHAGMFEGDYVACLRSDEVAGFYHDVQEMLAGSRNAAQYRSLEEWLSIDLTRMNQGEFVANCAARDELGSSQQLTFEIVSDRDGVEQLMASLEGWLRYLPVVGR